LFLTATLTFLDCCHFDHINHGENLENFAATFNHQKK